MHQHPRRVDLAPRPGSLTAYSRATPRQGGNGYRPSPRPEGAAAPTSAAPAARPTRRTRTTAKPSATIFSFEQARLRRVAVAQPLRPDPLATLECALEIYANALRSLIADIREQGDAQ